MKCLSLWQPWASLVVGGRKRWETRSWPATYCGPLLIHAAKKWDRSLRRICGMAGFREALDALGIDAFAPGRLGVILGRVELVGCVRAEDSLVRAAAYHLERVFGDFADGRWAWELRDPVAFAKPIPFPGRRMLFDVPDSLLPVG